MKARFFQLLTLPPPNMALVGLGGPLSGAMLVEGRVYFYFWNRVCVVYVFKQNMCVIHKTIFV